MDWTDSMILKAICLIFSFVLLCIPVVGTYFRVLNTLHHEVGHAFASILTGGRARKIQVFRNGSGLAFTSSSNWIGRVLVTFMGYPFASILAVTSAYLFVEFGAKVLLPAIIILLFGSMVVWVRNWFGFGWILCFILVSSIVQSYSNETWSSAYAIVLVGILLIQSLVSAVTVFRSSMKDKENAGDASDLAELTMMPAVFWGFVFFLQAAFFSLWGFIILFR